MVSDSDSVATGYVIWMTWATPNLDKLMVTLSFIESY
jgi:hypothetical protein